MMKYLGYLAEVIVAAILAAFLLSTVTFAADKCVDEYYAVKAGTLRHTCNNRFYVNKLTLRQYLDKWWKHRMDKENPSDPEELEEVFQAVDFLNKRWKAQQKEKGKK